MAKPETNPPVPPTGETPVLPKLDARLVFTVTKTEANGQTVPYFDTDLKYTDLGYDGLVVLERALVEALEMMNNYGIVKAEKKGDFEKLLKLKGMKDRLDAVKEKNP